MNTSPSFRILVFGAGATGCYIGGSLMFENHSVVFLARPNVRKQLQKNGLLLIKENGEKHLLNPQVVETVEQAMEYGYYDATLLTVKSFDTSSAIEQIKPFTENLFPIISLQNGVENEQILGEVFNRKNIIAGTLTSAIVKSNSGQIIVERERGIGIANEHKFAPQFIDLMNEVGLNARLYAQALDMKWSKLLTNLLGSATAAILDMFPREIFSDPKLYQLEIKQLREALTVMKALQARIVDLPGIPVKVLAFAAKSLHPTVSKPLLSRSIGRGRGDKMPTLHMDLHLGREFSEAPYLHGAIVKYGKTLGIPTPINSFLTETLVALFRRELPIDTYAQKPGKLLDDFAKLTT